jgi:hypothetical protein
MATYSYNSGLFEVHNTLSVNMVEHVKSLLGSFGLLDKVIAYVKDEGNNLHYNKRCPCTLSDFIGF